MKYGTLALKALANWNAREHVMLAAFMLGHVNPKGNTVCQHLLGFKILAQKRKRDICTYQPLPPCLVRKKAH